MTHVGASLNASISSGAGFGTLVMAVVMLMQTVSPLVASSAFARVQPSLRDERCVIADIWRSANWRNIGSAMQFARCPHDGSAVSQNK